MNNAHQWQDYIVKLLFEPEQRRLNETVKQLATRNGEIQGHKTPGFMLMGEIFIVAGVTWAKGNRVRLPSLAFELMEESNTFIGEKRRLDLEMQQIKQILFKLLINCNTLQDIRNSLPECVVNLIPQLKALERTLVDPAYHIRSDHRAVREYERLLPRIEMYTVTRLLY